ncbi:DUF2306 domain-containing protein [Sphingomonas sp. AOB5]|uniref:DUF2306 domain-containing protein n=1 Tax=Sphingomonas sp. AOB5 TaxID=3034017 RepID=UPI0023F9AD27|nr:DUF2306 domain-containing protein [Sphingomonas sp. AOB5]MDF7776101.1 DUF2306 domain-containing protein [Sphingomonas sp. AOB5]
MARKIETGPVPAAWLDPVYRWSAIALVAIVWLSSAIFGAYIIAHYMGSLANGDAGAWNSTLPHLYVAGSLAANIGIGVHFLLGAVLLLLGPVQLIAGVRNRWPRVHRWIGWSYTIAAFVTGAGGTFYILARGTTGGWVMDLGFGLYGALMMLAAAQTLRHAIARRLDRHRGWAIRLFALAIGSWLYRMQYGFWFLMFGTWGHASDFRGWFDMVMVFFFFVPNLLVAEAFIRSRGESVSVPVRAGGALVLAAAAVLVALATWTFTTKFWGPAILERIV